MKKSKQKIYFENLRQNTLRAEWNNFLKVKLPKVLLKLHKLILKCFIHLEIFFEMLTIFCT